MAAPTLREVTNPVAGDAQHWEGNDIIHLCTLLKGTHATERIPQAALEDGAMVSEAAAMIYKSGTDSKRRNGTTGVVDATNASAQTIIQGAVDAL